LKHQLRGHSRGTAVSRQQVVGLEAELVAQQWFVARGHVVENVAAASVQHDLVVSGIGRVQVKTVRRRIRPGKGDTYAANLQGRSAAGKTRYAVDAFEALLLVWFGSKRPRCVLVPASDLVALGGSAMVAVFSMGRDAFERRWSTVEVEDAPMFMAGEEATDGATATV
jgi:hypothetical protein